MRHSCRVASAATSPSQKRRRERRTYQFDKSSIKRASARPATDWRGTQVKTRDQHPAIAEPANRCAGNHDATGLYVVSRLLSASLWFSVHSIQNVRNRPWLKK